MLIKTIEVGSVEVLADKAMQVREDTVITEDGVELSRTYVRYTTVPGDDVSTRPQFVRDLSAFLWTAEVIADWIAKHPPLPPPPVV